MSGRWKAAWRALTRPQPTDRLNGILLPTESGIMVGEDSAMRFASVQACVRVLSEDIASLPLHVYRRTEDGGKERARDHPLYPLLHDQPNPEMTASAMRGAMMVNVLLYGNAYAFIEFDKRGRVKALWPISAGEVEPRRGDNGQIRYWIGRNSYAPAEILHIKGMTFDGLLGLSPIAYARETIGLGMAAEQFGKLFFKQGTHLGGVVTLPADKTLSDAAFARLSKQIQGLFKGLGNAHGVPLLEGGATYTPHGIPPEDAQFLETRKFQRTDIAAIYRVPLHMIGDLERATFSNIEHQDIGYLQRSITPWLVRWEQELSCKALFGKERERVLIEHDTNSFLRGDTQSRMGAYATAIQSGIMSPNEARMRENLNPKPGGDDILLPMNMKSGGDALVPVNTPDEAVDQGKEE